MRKSRNTFNLCQIYREDLAPPSSVSAWYTRGNDQCRPSRQVSAMARGTEVATMGLSLSLSARTRSNRVSSISLRLPTVLLLHQRAADAHGRSTLGRDERWRPLCSTRSVELGWSRSLPTVRAAYRQTHGYKETTLKTPPHIIFSVCL